MDIQVTLLHEDFYLVLKTEAGFLGHPGKLGPHGRTHPTLAVDDVTVGAAVETDNRGLGNRGQGDRSMRQAPGPQGILLPTWVLHPHLEPCLAFPGMWEGQTFPTTISGGPLPYSVSPQ